jgi:hypothetical protein
VTSVAFDRCRFISHYSPGLEAARPEIGLIFGDTPPAGFVRGVEIRGSLFRAAPGEPGNFSAIRFGPRGSYRHIEISDSPWIERAPRHRLFENEPDPDANVVLREDGITAYAGRTPRAWAVLEGGGAQKVPPGGPAELRFASVQGGLAGGATVTGGVRIPYRQVYEIDASVSVEAAAAGSAIELILTVDGRNVRKSTFAGAGIARQTATLRALLALEAGGKIGLHIAHNGGHEITVGGGADGRSLSVIAAA